MRAFLLVWGECQRLWRRWIVRLVAPSFTVGAACVIERDDGSILLVPARLPERLGLPGGLIKRKEDMASCARRGPGGDRARRRADQRAGRGGRQPAPAHRRRVPERPAPGVDAAAAHARSAELREVAWFPAGELPELQHEAVSALMALASSALGPVERGATDDDGEGDAGPDAALRLAAARAAGQR